MNRHGQLTAVLLACVLLLSGCKTRELVTKGVTTVGVATGTISSDHAQSINKTAEAAGKAFEQITPEQEYFIGRAVAASILSTYKPYEKDRATTYINTLGQALAMASDKPETFGGYHFLIMDTDEVNAFAAPGGLIMVSRGLLRCCRSEDALAAVLAHEVGHVQFGHGLQAIKKSRLTGVFTTLAAEGAKSFGGEQLAQLTEAFEGTVSDITGTLVNSGYSRKFEGQADRAAIDIMQRVGYNPQGLKDMLTQMGQLMKPDDHGFGKTHPAPADRITDIDPLLADAGALESPAERQNRFKRAMQGI